MIQRATLFILLLGLVSLLADVTYEGARSASGQFLADLGASGAIVGSVAGFAEMFGYMLRVFTGVLSDRTERPWLFTYVGYVLNLLAVPLLAFATNWQSAACLIVLERIGKAIRTPSRDAMLSYATEKTGRGWGFGLHEAMDRTGAVFGPLVIVGVLSSQHGYHAAFAVLAIPAIAALIALTIAKHLFPKPIEFEPPRHTETKERLSAQFFIAVLALSFVAAGTVDFPLVGFHLAKGSYLPAESIPLLCALAMATDGIASLIFGRLYDLKGRKILVIVIFLASASTPLLFLCNGIALYFGAMLWGIGIGTQQSMARALIANLVPVRQRGSAYGIFNLSYGVFWFLGSFLMGVLYDVSLHGLVAVSVGCQLAAIFLLTRRYSFFGSH